MSDIQTGTESTQTAVEPASSPEPTTTEVPISEATDADLDAFLAQAQAAYDESPQDDLVSEETPPTEDAQTEGLDKTDQLKDAKTDDPIELEIRSLKQEIDRLKQQREQQELFIKRRNTEVGDLRKAKAEAEQRLKQLVEAEDSEILSPLEAVKRAKDIETAKSQVDALGQQENLQAYYQTQVQALETVIKPEEFNLEGYAHLLKADGVPQSHIQKFMENPLQITNADVIIQLHRRLESEMLLKRVVDYAKEIQAERDKLKKGSQSLLQKADDSFRRNPSITASSGGASAPTKQRITDLTKLSDEELDALEKSLKNAA